MPSQTSAGAGARRAAKPPASIDVYFVLPRGSLLLDWAGPAEALRMANLELREQGWRGDDAFRLRFVAPQTTSQSSVGAMLSALEPLPTEVPTPAWIVVVGRMGTSKLRPQRGGAVVVDDDEDRRVVEWLQRLQPGRNGLRLVTVCSGALLAARAGLLKQRRATTHHLDVEALAQLDSSMTVARDRVFVRDGEVWTSAGVTAGIDLALHLVADHVGPLVAARVAQRMAVAVRRGPDDPQLSAFLAHRQHFSARLHAVQDAVSHAPREDWDVQRMAALAHTTPRTLARLFASMTGITPMGYVRDIRLALARTALEAGSSVAGAAALSGFTSDLQLRRAWRAAGMPAHPSHMRSSATVPTPVEAREAAPPS